MFAHQMNAKEIWGHRSRPVTPAPERLREVCERTDWSGSQSLRDLAGLLRADDEVLFWRACPRDISAEDFMDSDGISDGPVKIAVAVRCPEGRTRASGNRGHTVTSGLHGY